MNMFKWVLIVMIGFKGLFAMSTDELLTKLNNPEIVIVDTRSEDAYNGWRLNNEVRGGHIPNALVFPVSFMEKIKDTDPLLSLLKSKKEVIVYGEDIKQTSLVATFLQSKQVPVKLLDIRFSEYALNDKLPLVTLPRYEMLVPAQYIQNLLNKKASFSLFEVSWGKGKAYNKEHIPSAIHINSDEIEKGPIWNYKSKKQLKKFALKYGISKKKPIILYGADSMASFRLAILLQSMGVNDVRVLNGGFKAWLEAGYKTQKKKNKPKRIASFGGEFFDNEDLIITTEAAQKLLKNTSSQLVSIRSKEEYEGITSGYSYIKPKGRIKGSVWGKSGSDAYHLEDYRSINNKMLSVYLIEKMWKELGVDASKNLAFYCGTGWRAAEVLFYAKVMGLKDVSLYDGGWLQWSLDPSLAIENSPVQ